INSLYNSKPDLIKELYAALLSVTAEFVRTGQNRDEVAQFLGPQCSYSASRTNLYGDYYEKNREEIEAGLVNVGNHLPHVTDVSWKIDYIIKTSNLDRSEGPLFRIGLQTEKFDPPSRAKKIKFINFTCTSQELQDLVYKLKDALRHCQRIG
ncbi:COMM domain-containing protein 3, partial [Asbolus verrucosus]